MNNRKPLADSIFDIMIYAYLMTAVILTVYPIFFMFIASVSDPFAVSSGKVIWHPVGLTLEGYSRIFGDARIMSGYVNSIFITLSGTVISISIMLPAAFALSRKELKGRNIIMIAITFTMYFSGGIMPLYLVVKSLRLLNQIWSVIFPGAIVTYYLIVTRTFFSNSIPEELFEAATMDGFSYTRFFIYIVAPLSKSIVAVMILFYAVGYWNGYFAALMYLTDEKRFPIQLILRGLLLESQAVAMAGDDFALAEKTKIAELIKYGVSIAACLPVIVIYPFIQKYFVQGVMIGSVKG